MYVSTYSPWQSALGYNFIQSGFSPYQSSFAPYATSFNTWPGVNVTPGGAISYSFVPTATGNAMSYGFNPNLSWQGLGSFGANQWQGLGSFGANQWQGLGSFGANQFGLTSGISSPIQTGAGLTQPRIELAETNSDVVITAELPNVNPNNLHITATDDSVTISALAFAGNMATSIHRTVALPTQVRCEQVDASYANGILEARLPKSDVSARRRVRVNVVG